MPLSQVRGNANRGNGGDDAELIPGSFGIHTGEPFTACYFHFFWYHYVFWYHYQDALSKNCELALKKEPLQRLPGADQ
jgi:hypothetical protein